MAWGDNHFINIATNAHTKGIKQLFPFGMMESNKNVHQITFFINCWYCQRGCNEQG
jgi:hypothetical protein